MNIRTLTIAAVSVALGVFGVAPASGLASSFKRPAPSLRLVALPGYRLGVAGAGWGARHKVTFSLQQQSRVVGLELRAARAGRFTIGVRNIDLCNGEVFVARDLHGDRVQIEGPPLACPASLHPPVPVLTVVKGRQVHIAIRHVDFPSQRGRVVIRRSNALYLWEPGTRGPTWIPSAPEPYFSLIASGTTPPRECPRIECSAGFFWEWVGMKRGLTGIAMNPSCYPRCEIASELIEVRIT